MKKLLILTPPDGDSDGGQVGNSDFFWVDNLDNAELQFNEPIFHMPDETEHEEPELYDPENEDDEEEEEETGPDALEVFWNKIISLIEQHGYVVTHIPTDDVIIRDLD